MIRQIRKGIYAVVILIGLIVAGLYFFQESLIFPAQELDSAHEFRLEIPFKEEYLTSKDGAQLNYLWLQVENSKGLLVYYHGNGGSLERWKDVVLPFTQLGWEVLVWDYRGYGKSTGERSSEALYDDAQQIYVKAMDTYGQDQILVYGRSMGSTFAAYVAARNKPALLILESPFYSLNSLVKDKYPIIPVNRLLNFEFPTYTFAPAINCEVYIFHGNQDGVVPFEQGERLSKEFVNGSELITVQGADHNNIANFSSYQDKLLEILGRSY